MNMKNFKSKSAIITIFLSITSVLNVASGDVCDAIYYGKKPSNPPDLVVFQSTEKRHFLEKDDGLQAICRIRNQDDRASLIVNDKSFIFADEYAYDRAEDTLYRAEYCAYNKLNLQSEPGVVKKWVDFFSYEASGELPAYPEHIALDWVSKNFYIQSQKSIIVINLNDESKPKKTIIDNITFSPISSLHVFPNQGYLVLQIGGNITRYNLDGSEPQLIYSNTNAYIDVMSVDYYNNNIYWIERSGKNYALKYTDLEGKTEKVFKIPDLGSLGTETFKNLAVDKNYVYYTVDKDKKNFINRADKTNGAVDLNFELNNDGHKGIFMSITALSGLPQVTPDNHPCKDSSKACPGYCFGIPDGNGGLLKRCK